jgi:hypothetical protein
MERRVDFMLIGAQKAGTTSLAGQLAENPQIGFSREKEPHYFSTHRDWEAGLGRYHRLFPGRSAGLWGEASTSYSFVQEYPHVPDCLREYNPKLRLIYMLRDPVERIISHYAHRRMRGIAHRSPEVELGRRSDYLERSRYGLVLRAYGRAFPRDQLLVLLFERYVADPEGLLRQVCEFLNVPFVPVASLSARNRSVGSNRGPGSPLYYVDRLLAHSPALVRRVAGRRITLKLAQKPQLSPELKQSLWHALRDDVALVETYLGTELTQWRAKHERKG